MDHAALLIVVAGPTGAGKSALALDLAAAFGGEIVNFDSLQLYRGFDVGTAKTPVSARRGIPHHLFDVLDPSDGYSAGEYARLARRVISEISARNHLPIAVGGSGFYLRALLEGLPPLPSRDPAIRARLETREQRAGEQGKPGSLHRLLTRLDPAAAARIHPRDVHKTIRALEIRLLTRSGLPRPESGEPLRGYRILCVGLNPERKQLFERLNARVESMFSGGLIEEVRSLLACGVQGRPVTGAEKPFESLGYKQALQFIRGQAALEQAILSTQIETRQYAKRQWTWFRKTPGVRWIAGFGDQPSVVRETVDLAAPLVALSDRTG